MLAKVYSSAVFGVDAYQVEVEVYLGGGLPSILSSAYWIKRIRWLIYPILTVIPLLFSSCAVMIIPIPHIPTVVPPVEGRIIKDGAPVENKTIVFSWGHTDTGWKYTAETTTSSDGSFSLPGRRKFRLFAVVVPGADCGYQYRLTVIDQTGEAPLTIGWLFGPCDAPPEHLTIDCSLEKSAEDCCEVSAKGPYMDMGRKSVNPPRE